MLEISSLQATTWYAEIVGLTYGMVLLHLPGPIYNAVMILNHIR